MRSHRAHPTCIDVPTTTLDAFAPHAVHCVAVVTPTMRIAHKLEPSCVRSQQAWAVAARESISVAQTACMLPMHTSHPQPRACTAECRYLLSHAPTRRRCPSRGHVDARTRGAQAASKGLHSIVEPLLDAWPSTMIVLATATPWAGGLLQAGSAYTPERACDFFKSMTQCCGHRRRLPV